MIVGPAAMQTYCVPSISYVIGPAFQLCPVLKPGDRIELHVRHRERWHARFRNPCTDEIPQGGPGRGARLSDVDDPRTMAAARAV